jgi:hypothetical protein
MGAAAADDDAPNTLVECASGTKDRRCVIFATRPSGGPGRLRRTQRRVGVIRVADLDAAVAQGSALLQVTMQPALARDAARLLGSFQNHLVCLNHQHWLCTWEVNGDAASCRRHFFLPKDWIHSETLSLNVLTDHGSLLCPRNGEVAIIRNGIRL